MNLFNHSYSTPAENLAIDEELLKAVDKGAYPDGILRLWESLEYFVVLGLSKTIEDDVHNDACKTDNYRHTPESAQNSPKYDPRCDKPKPP